MYVSSGLWTISALCFMNKTKQYMICTLYIFFIPVHYYEHQCFWFNTRVAKVMCCITIQFCVLHLDLLPSIFAQHLLIFDYLICIRTARTIRREQPAQILFYKVHWPVMYQNNVPNLKI